MNLSFLTQLLLTKTRLTKSLVLVGVIISTSVSVGEDIRSPVSTKNNAPVEVQDLRYGVMLYHFFQQSYFESLTEALVGEQRKDMPHHQRSAKLLRGGISLSYGMGKQAESIFTELLNGLDNGKEPDQTQSSQRERAWFYLAKLYYLRSDNIKAARALGNIEPAGPVGHTGALRAIGTGDESFEANTKGKSRFDKALLPDELQQEKNYMAANLLLDSNQFAEANETISRLDETSPWLAYYYFNRGSRETTAGDWQQGVESFRQIQQLELGGEEGRILKDKSYIGSGFTHLGAGQYEKAIEDFLKVRLESPLVEKALLGYGWAAAQEKDFLRALAPWQALSKRSLMSSSVQESLLAIPYAFEKLKANADALQKYQRATELYEIELEKVAQAIKVFKKMPLLEMISRHHGKEGEWIGGHDNLPINDQAPYLSHLIAQNHFQSTIDNLRDLLTMQAYLQRASTRIATMQEVLNSQRVIRKHRLSQAQRQQYREQYKNLESARNRIEVQQTIAEQEADGRQLLSKKELELWGLVSNSGSIIRHLEHQGQDVGVEKSKLDFFKGLLLWQANEEDIGRRWQLKQQLATVEKSLSETRLRLERLDDLSVDYYEGRFSLRIANLSQRLKSQSGIVDGSIARTETKIRDLAVTELEKQTRHLSYYLAQAKLSVARLHDSANVESF